MDTQPQMKLFDRLTNYTSPTTPHEQLLVDYIVANYPNALLESATAISKAVGISASTTTRFFSKIGYKGYVEAQREARSQISMQRSSPAQRLAGAGPGERSIKEVVASTFQTDIENLNNTLGMMDLRALEAFIETLASVDQERHVFIIGAKNIRSAATCLHTHLNMCIPNVHLLSSDSSTIADSLLRVTSKDVLFVFTIRRYAKITSQVARYFKGKKACILAVTDSPMAGIVDLADHSVLISTASGSAFDSHTAAIALCNALITAVSMRRKAQVESLLKRGEEVWNCCDVFVKNHRRG